MDTPRVVRLPVAVDRSETASTDIALADIVAAIELVAIGGARRVILTGLAHVDEVASQALAHAQAANLEFRIERDQATGAVTVLIGPLTE